MAWVALVGCRPEYGLYGPVVIDPSDILPCDFVPIEGSALWSYGCNPVFTGSETGQVGGEGVGAVAFRAQTLLGHPLYQLWYTTPPLGGDGGWTLGHAISTNGVDWLDHPANPVVEESGGWDRSNMDQISVVWDTRRREYVLTYQGYDLDPVDPTFGLGVLTSADGVAWTSPVGRAPALDLSLVQNGRDYCWPMSFTFEEGRYHGLLAGHEIGQQLCQVYAFEATDIAGPFAIQAELVLAAGPLPYDAAGMASASTVRLPDGRWYMFYVGFEGWEPVQANVVRPVGYHLALATSLDGRTWTKDPRNPLPIDQGEVTHVAAQVVGSRIQLWVTDDYPELGHSAVGTFLFDPDAHAAGLTSAP